MLVEAGKNLRSNSFKSEHLFGTYNERRAKEGPKHRNSSHTLRMLRVSVTSGDGEVPLHALLD
jgi:hypothetical protein